jgi:hypothetical protein
MFRHYRVIIRQPVITGNTLEIYKSISNAAVGNIIYNCVNCKTINYMLPEDDTIVSKHAGM